MIAFDLLRAFTRGLAILLGGFAVAGLFAAVIAPQLWPYPVLFFACAIALQYYATESAQ